MDKQQGGEAGNYDPIGCGCDEYPECTHALYWAMGYKKGRAEAAAQPSELRVAAQMALDWFDKGLGQSAYAAEVMERLRAALRKG
jgi:hypothetical protein